MCNKDVKQKLHDLGMEGKRLFFKQFAEDIMKSESLAENIPACTVEPLSECAWTAMINCGLDRLVHEVRSLYEELVSKETYDG